MAQERCDHQKEDHTWARYETASDPAAGEAFIVAIGIEDQVGVTEKDFEETRKTEKEDTMVPIVSRIDNEVAITEQPHSSDLVMIIVPTNSTMVSRSSLEVVSYCWLDVEVAQKLCWISNCHEDAGSQEREGTDATLPIKLTNEVAAIIEQQRLAFG